jgi:hypothetical protein
LFRLGIGGLGGGERLRLRWRDGEQSAFVRFGVSDEGCDLVRSEERIGEDLRWRESGVAGGVELVGVTMVLIMNECKERVNYGKEPRDSAQRDICSRCVDRRDIAKERCPVPEEAFVISSP